jgi:hypothetical protein
MIDEILEQEIKIEQELLLKIKNLQVDSESKNQIRARAYDRYKDLRTMIELEKC